LVFHFVFELQVAAAAVAVAAAAAFDRHPVSVVERNSQPLIQE
jgi:hypothetical protein